MATGQLYCRRFRLKSVALGPKENAPSHWPISLQDAYTTDLAHEELVSEVIVKMPGKGSGGAYLAFKRSAPVYPTASVAVQLTMEGDTCKNAAISLGCVGLTAVNATEAAAALRGQTLDDRAIFIGDGCRSRRRRSTARHARFR